MNQNSRPNSSLENRRKVVHDSIMYLLTETFEPTRLLNMAQAAKEQLEEGKSLRPTHENMELMTISWMVKTLGEINIIDLDSIRARFRDFVEEVRTDSLQQLEAHVRAVPDEVRDLIRQAAHVEISRHADVATKLFDDLVMGKVAIGLPSTLDGWDPIGAALAAAAAAGTSQADLEVAKRVLCRS